MRTEGINNSQGPFSESTHNTMFRQGLYGAIISSIVAVASGPLVYLKNMIMAGSPPIWNNCLRGIPSTALNDVPAAVVAMSLDGIGKRYFLARNLDEPMTTSQKALTASSAGAISGFLITPGQLGVLHYQKKVQENGKILSIPQIFSKAYRAGGIRRLFTGASFVMAREMKYALAYLLLADTIAMYAKGLFKREEFNVALGAFLAGGFTGLITTPDDFMCIQKQRLALSKTKIHSYPQIYRSLKRGELSTGAVPRMLCLGISIYGLVLGRRYFFPSVTDGESVVK